jgi:hypothetical protein
MPKSTEHGLDIKLSFNWFKLLEVPHYLKS